MKSERYQDERLTLPEEFVPGKIGVVTVLYNSVAVLPDFINSLEKQVYNNFVTYYIDNASTDNFVALCKTHNGQYQLIINDHNQGVARGNNQGIRAAVADGCEFVLLINNDVIFEQDLFQQLISGMNTYQCSMTTPLMYYHDRPTVIWAAGGYFQWYFGYRCLHHGDGTVDHGQYRSPRRVPYTPTCCVLLRRHLFFNVGMMDERYFVYYDDTDFMLRAYRNDESLYLLPHAKLWHKVSSLAGASSSFRTRYVYRNHALYGHKHLPFPISYLISFIYCTGYLFLPLVGRISFSDASKRVLSWVRGIRAASVSKAI